MKGLLRALLDHLDFTAGACRPNEMVGAVLPPELLARLKVAARTVDPVALEPLQLVAWVGEDERGSGEIGLKQAYVPAGLIPMVAVDRDRWKLKRERPQFEGQAARYGKRIYLCRFVLAEVLEHTDHGQAPGRRPGAMQ